jgi:hypothetical protein
MEERYLSTRGFTRILAVPMTDVIKCVRGGRITAYNFHGRQRILVSKVKKLLKSVR